MAVPRILCTGAAGWMVNPSCVTPPSPPAENTTKDVSERSAFEREREKEEDVSHTAKHSTHRRKKTKIKRSISLFLSREERVEERRGKRQRKTHPSLSSARSLPVSTLSFCCCWRALFRRTAPRFVSTWWWFVDDVFEEMWQKVVLFVHFFFCFFFASPLLRRSRSEKKKERASTRSLLNSLCYSPKIPFFLVLFWPLFLPHTSSQLRGKEDPERERERRRERKEEGEKRARLLLPRRRSRRRRRRRFFFFCLLLIRASSSS